MVGYSKYTVGNEERVAVSGPHEDAHELSNKKDYEMRVEVDVCAAED